MTTNRENCLVVMIPILDDWEAFQKLLPQLDTVLHGLGESAIVVLVDDGSQQLFDPKGFSFLSQTAINEIVVLRLNRNMGHQAAIAIGLSYAETHYTPSRVIVMDGDGEDVPDDIERLAERASAERGAVVFAERTSRSETLLFRLLYQAYKLVFRLLTGERIAFGNYALIPGSTLSALVLWPELWLSLPATVIRSKVKFTATPTRRGLRYAQDSRFSLIGLVMHGMSAITVFSERLAMRIILLCVSLIAVCVIAIVIAFGIKAFTDLATPNWATSLVFGFSIICLILMATCLQILFAVLGQRTQKKMIPRETFMENISDVNIFRISAEASALTLIQEFTVERNI